MKRLLYLGILIVFAVYMAPAAYIWAGGGQAAVTPDTPVPVTGVQDGVPTEAPKDHSVVTVQIDGKATEMPLEDYVEGVVAAEISADFPIEAIRAQAVAARTYAVYKIDRGRPHAHPNADVCDDFHHCAAYRDLTALTADDSSYQRIVQAVQDTAGEILTYDGAPIAAVFHCASAPRTESAEDVWGSDIPYLQSVVSPGGTAYTDYESAVTVTAEDFRKSVHETFPTADVSGAPATWFKASVRSAAGGIKTVQLGGVTVEGSAVRELFDLRSTNFTITTTDDSLTFHTIGYGHGVGLSQYGAKYFAEQGEDYQQILLHYYPETSLIKS